ncbi:Plasma membrane fusion protein PRM1 [Hanseniaspora osmophila]|uniref:Plasma membrane fusion protein PRM1 n=1 Tax=Hanseniaspora osmophila TaxID=56408 RepID=A0A1E5RH63_9ASCO|nr:Plasma membrane fusion protein PRM1 [Hanseniaspora osmophila]
MPELKPYLSFQDRLSQIWINKYTILCMLFIFKLLVFSSQVQKSLNNVKSSITESNSACYYYDLMVNETPYYMSLMANYMLEKSIEESIKMSLKILSEVVYIVEQIIIFMFDMWCGTYLCLIMSAVDGAVDVATNVTESLVDLANSTMHSAAQDINKGLSGLSSLVNGVVTEFDKLENELGSLFNKNTDKENSSTTQMSTKISNISLTVSKLSNFYINSDIDSKLRKLSKETPDFDTVKNKTHSLIAIPFNKVIAEFKQVNTTRYVKPANISLKPVQFVKQLNQTGNKNTKNTLTTSYDYCENVILPEFTSFFKKFNKIVLVFQIIVVILLIVVALASCVPEFYKEFFFWKKIYKFKDRVDNNLSEEEVGGLENPFDIEKPARKTFEMDVIGEMFTVFPGFVGVSVLNMLPCFDSQNVKTRWWIHYVFSKRAAILFMISISGLICCLIQYILVRYMEKLTNQIFPKTTPSLASDKQATIITNVMGNMSTMMNSSFQSWSTNTNAFIDTVQYNINNEMVIRSIETITDSLNTTATSVLSDLNGVINKFFNNTILEKPTMSIMHCVIGNKLESLIQEFTWVHDEFQISIPKPSTSELGELYNSVTSNKDSNASNTFETHMTSIFQKIGHDLSEIIVFYKATIKNECILWCTLLALWLLQVPLGLIILTCRYKI